MLKVGDIVTRGTDKGTVQSLSPLRIRKYGVQPVAYYPNPDESEWRLENLPPSPPPSTPPFGVQQKKYGTFGARRKSRKSRRKTHRRRR